MFRTIFSVLAVLIASVSATSCSAEDIVQFQSADFTERVLRFSMRKSTKKTLLMKTLGTSEKAVIKKLMPKAQLDLQVSAPCTECYVKNILCTFDHCSSQCVRDPLGQACRDCNQQHCMAALLFCLGPEAAASMPGEPTAETLTLALTSSEDEN